ncbi:MAG: hypothetical protein NPINA01_14690 [Nitrospinaceae bacterium]|nr:MAG: hypothetical protein NPINA01_14690 [Nitrospinaceae bacterium]
MVRHIDTEPLGYPSPAGLGFSNAAGTFLVLESPATPPASTSDVIVISEVGDLLGTATLAASVENPLNMTFDNQGNRLLIFQPGSQELLEIAADAFGVLQPNTLTSINAGQFGLQDPRGMTVDPQSGNLYILDGNGPNIVRIVPDASQGFAQATVSTVSLAGKGLDGVRGIAFDPVTGNFHMLDSIGQLLYEVTETGLVAVSRDVSGLGLSDPQGMVFAPSGDQTDDPSVLNLYIADSGLGGAAGNITELQLTQAAPVASASAQAQEPDFVSTLIRTIDASAFSPPSPDTAGVAFMSSGFYSGTLFLADSEVNEIGSLFTGDNLFNITLDGILLDTLTAISFSDEPTGIAFNSSNNHLFISDDDAKRIFELNPGADGQFNTADDVLSSFDTTAFGSTDPEGIAYDPFQGFLYMVDGINSEVYEISPGPNGIFDGVGVDDVVTSFDVGVLGVQDPEGITYDTVAQLLYVVGRSSQDIIVALTTAGALIQNIDISAANPIKAAGLAFAPSSGNPALNSLYLADRGVDNNADPNENDGKVYELTIPNSVTPGNTPPDVNAGLDQAITLPDDAVLDGTVTDDGETLPVPTITWSKVSGPGTVTFANENVEDTTASFSTAGSYVLRLSAFDGEQTRFDDMTVTASNFGEATVDIRIAASSDDAEERSTGNMSLSSSDLEMVFDSGGNQTVGLRFTGVNIPPGSTILSAYVQFQVDEVNTGATPLTVQGQNSANPATFTSAGNNITLRPLTTASVPWSPAPWNSVGEAGLDQRTPDISSVIQEIVNLPGWASGNPLAVIIGGTGERTAESFDGTPSAAPLLHIVFSTIVGSETVPDVVGLAQAAAEAAIVNANLVVGTITQQSSVTVPVGDVISQNPIGGTSVAPGTAVNLVVSTGSVPVNVPNVVGLTQAAAETAIVNASLVVGTVTLESSNTVPAGDVISQNPIGGTSVPSGSAVDLVVSTGPPGSGVTVDVRVSAGSDDAEERATGSVSLSSTDLELVFDSGGNQTVGLRFLGVAIPPGATITEAYVQFQADETHSGVTSLTVQGQNSANPATFTSATNNITSRPLTTASVPWSPVPWNIVGEAGPDQRTADISSVIQEIVNLPGWASGNALAVIISGSGERVAESFNGIPSAAPLLHVVYSTGVPVNVPDVVGLAQAAAETAIVNASLVVGTVTQQSSATVPLGDVISQNPIGGSTALSGSAVDLVVSLGPPVNVPNVVGLAQAAAETAIVNAGLVVGTVTTQGSPTVPAGDVISQNPIGGTSVDPGSVVDLVVSSGPTPVNVPNVVGLAQAAAETAIVNAGLVVGTVTQQSSATVPAGDVISQNPIGGTSVAPGSAVDLVVSTGPVPVNVPDVVGLAQAAAESAIVNAGLVVGTVTQQSSDTVPAGDVISQNPIGGTSVPSGSAVDLVVSSGPPGSGLTIDVRISAGSDDAEERATGSMSLSSTDLEMVFDSGGNQTVGLRFAGVDIPPGATITDAYIQFQADETHAGATTLTVRGQNSANPATFTSATNNITLRPLTTASVPWSPAPWNSVGEAGLNQQTPNISSIVQEIINLPGWAIGNPLAVIISGSGERVAESFNGVPGAAPLLHVVFSAGAPVNVPDVVGLTQAAAESAITGASLVVGTVTPQSSETVPAGDVISQNPVGGSSVAPGSSVNLVVSSGPPGTGLTLDVRVSSNSDDAEERANGTVNNGSSDLELVFDSGGNQTVGVRFQGVTIPPGATINNAYVQFQADEVNTGATSLTVQGQDVINAASFATVVNNITSRPLTTAAVPWFPAPWNTVGEAGLDQRTPDISAVIQEIINLPGWASGNPLAIILSGTGERTAESFNGVPGAAPLLHVEYSTVPP